MPLPLQLAWIGQLHHIGKQGVRLLGIQSHLRHLSFLIGRIKHRACKNLSGLGMEALDQDAFRAVMLNIPRIGLAKPACQPELLPPGGSIAGPGEAGRIDEGL